MRRRELCALLGCASAWPIRVVAQQPVMPVIGVINPASPEPWAHMFAAFRAGLEQTGFVEGRNVTIDYRWARGRYDQFDALAADLVKRQVAVIVATGGVLAAAAAKRATSTIPIVFTAATDPVEIGLVDSYNRPGGNVTGVHVWSTLIGAKRVALLKELAPEAKVIAVLINPTNRNWHDQVQDIRTAAEAVGLQIEVVRVSSEVDFEAAFGVLDGRSQTALMTAADPFLNSQRERVVALAARHKLPAIYDFREFTEAGGLMSYGTSLPDAYRQAGVYVGRILGGAKPAELPVVRSEAFELVVNLKTSRALGFSVSPTLLARADEVIE